MTWQFLLLSSIGLSVDTFVLSLTYGYHPCASEIKKLLVAPLVFASASGLMLSIGWLVASTVLGTHVLRMAFLSDVVLLLLGLQLFSGSFYAEQSCQHDRSGGFLVVASLVSAIDAAAFGATLPLSGQPLWPMLVLLFLVAAAASSIGIAAGFHAHSVPCRTAQAYGGILMMSLGGCGVI